MKGARELPKIMVRLPEDVKERLQQRAKLSLRSMNSEVVDRLVRTLNEDEVSRDAQK